MSSVPARLACPAGHAVADDDGRFCAVCGLPLVLGHAVAPELTERRERARKVSPQYGEGRLVKVGWARNQAEAEFLSGMLLEEGVPSVVKRAGGFDVPDFLAAGPRDILVAASGVDVARDVLRPVDQPAGAGQSPPGPRASETGTLPAGPEPRASRSRTARAPWVRVLALLLVTILVAIVLAGLVNALAG